MNNNKYFNFLIEGEYFKGERLKLISFLEAKGYQAEREEENPHPYWQASEYLKRC